MIRLFFLLFLSVPASASPAEGIRSERVHMQTDRNIYIAGEYLYFSADIVSENSETKALSNICYIMLRNSQQTILKFYIRTNSEGAHSALYLPDTLKTGYYEIVAFTNYMRNFGEELFFRKQLLIVNRFDQWLDNLNTQAENHLNDSLPMNSGEIIIKTDKEVYGTREKVNIRLQSHENLRDINITVKANNSYPVLLGKFKSEKNIELINQVKFYPEFDKMILYGRIIKEDSVPVSDECLFISTPDSFANLQYTYSTRNGNFSFELNDYYLGKKLIISTREDRNNRYKIHLYDKFELLKPFVPVKIGITPELRKYILESQSIVKFLKGYNIERNRKEVSQLKNVNTSCVYATPTRTVFPSQYVSLDNFGEIAANLLDGYRIRIKDGVKKGFHVNPVDGLLYSVPGGTFLNGVYLYNLNPLTNFSSADIFKLELCQEPRVKGNIQFIGILSVSTHKEIDYPSILPGCVVYILENSLHTFSYQTPDYDKILKEDPLPDFRQTLYWKSFSNPDHPIEFFTSDLTGDYIVEVNAITSSGKQVHSFSILKVQNQ